MLQPLSYQANMTMLKMGIAQKCTDLTNKMSASIDYQSEELLRTLQHDVEWCGDPKSFYEKELPYRLESVARKDLHHFSEIISQSYSNYLYWLQENLRRLGVKNFCIDFQYYKLNVGENQQEKLNLIDIHKTKLYTRVGTLVTAICLSGFGIGFFAASILGGIITEESLLSSSKNSKKRIISVLPTIVERYKTQLKLHVLEAVSVPKGNIIKTLNNISYEQCGVY